MDITGVRYCTKTNRYIAFWNEGKTKKSKSFKVSRWGKDQAFQLACIARWSNTSGNLPFSIKINDITQEAQDRIMNDLLPWRK